MVCVMHLPNVVFVFLSQAMPDNFHLMDLAIAVAGIVMSFGFTAYTMFMIMVSGENTKRSTTPSPPESWPWV